jgi:hypothetical protein
MAEPNFEFTVEFPDKSEDEHHEQFLETVYAELVDRGRESGMVEVPNKWGLQKRYLDAFGFDNLEDIYCGTHNLWVPGEMLNLENPTEILANYLAAGKLKRCNRHLEDDVPRDSFSKLIKFMNVHAYSRPSFIRIINGFKDTNRFPVKPGYQEKRLKSLSGEVKRQFCASFFNESKPSQREERSNPDAFYDPRTKSGYVDRIWAHIGRRFERQ